jgi:hypothetical protein
MRALTALTLLAAAACSSSGTAPVNTAPGTSTATGRVVTTEGSTVQMNTMNIDTDVRVFVTGTPDEAWAVLPGVYAELGIPLTTNDSRTKSIGNTGWKTRRFIGKQRMQQYFDCGSSGTIYNAETYELNISILTTVRSNPSGGSVISTAMTASGKNPITSSSAEVRCATTGNLELRIRDMVQKALYAK